VPKLLITGHTGFVGRVLAEHVTAEHGDRWNLATLAEHQDVRDPKLGDHIAPLRADAVIHLAARTSVSESFQDPDGYFDVNFQGTLNLLRALRTSGFRGRFLYVSSGDCYGTIDEAQLPVDELQPLRPRNPYAVSKVATEALCFQWSQTEGLDAIIARPFNHIGQGQDERFVVPSLVKQVCSIRDGRSPNEIVAGNLEVTRDLTDVRDVVKAYIALLEKGRKGHVYNIGSGREVRIRDVLGLLLDLANVNARVTTDPQRTRRDEQLRMRADVAKIKSHTGWTSRIPLDESLRDILAAPTDRLPT
jgi:GDP-4-dehydro-6-deoxy-D-mannose reductase